jgi:hypothetical protein
LSPVSDPGFGNQFDAVKIERKQRGQAAEIDIMNIPNPDINIRSLTLLVVSP